MFAKWGILIIVRHGIGSKYGERKRVQRSVLVHCRCAFHNGAKKFQSLGNSMDAFWVQTSTVKIKQCDGQSVDGVERKG